MAIGCKNKSGKYELRDEIVFGDDEYVLITDRTNFYPESGGQLSDRGVMKSSEQIFQVEKVISLKGYTFHCGKLEKSSNETAIKVNDHVECMIDSTKRYQTSLNHTGVHVLNHAIRKHFGFENAIIQTNSIVSDDHLKFEFKFNEMMHKPTTDDLAKIQAICNEIIHKSVPVYTNDVVNLDVDDLTRFKYPVRKLNDILYPVNIRLVSLGASWDKFERFTSCFLIIY